jgi:four helix bundle protein
LEDRTLKFANEVIQFIAKVPRNISCIEITKQLVRSAGSVGANYIEANESLSKKDFLMRIRICKKEAKETRYWLNLLEVAETLNKVKTYLIQEVTEFMKIFGAIIEKSK